MDCHGMPLRYISSRQAESGMFTLQAETAYPELLINHSQDAVGNLRSVFPRSEPESSNMITC